MMKDIEIKDDVKQGQSAEETETHGAAKTKMDSTEQWFCNGLEEKLDDSGKLPPKSFCYW